MIQDRKDQRHISLALHGSLFPGPTVRPHIHQASSIHPKSIHFRIIRQLSTKHLLSPFLQTFSHPLSLSPSLTATHKHTPILHRIHLEPLQTILYAVYQGSGMIRELTTAGNPSSPSRFSTPGTGPPRRSLPEHTHTLTRLPGVDLDFSAPLSSSPPSSLRSFLLFSFLQCVRSR